MLLLLWVKFHSVALALKDKYAFAFLKKLHLLFKKLLFLVLFVLLWEI